jgi:hypothetical protein
MTRMSDPVHLDPVVRPFCQGLLPDNDAVQRLVTTVEEDARHCRQALEDA